MGRPSKLEPERQKRLCAALRGCNHYEAACAYAGIGFSTFRRWMLRGAKQKKGEYREFWEAVKSAVQAGERRIVAKWRKQCPENWQACRDLLARRHPDRWGVKDTLKHQGDAKRPVVITNVEAVRPPDADVD